MYRFKIKEWLKRGKKFFRKRERRSCVEILDTNDIEVCINLIRWEGSRISLTTDECLRLLQALNGIHLVSAFDATPELQPGKLYDFLFLACKTPDQYYATANFYISKIQMIKGQLRCTSNSLAYTYRHFHK